MMNRLKLSPEEIRERLNNETSQCDRTHAWYLLRPGQETLTRQEEKDAFEIAVVNDVLSTDGMEHQGLLL